MGRGYKCICDKCGEKNNIALGIGLLDSKKEIVEEIIAGKWGKEAKEVFEKTPNVSVDCDRVTAKCDKCKKYCVVYDGSFYTSKYELPISRIDEKLHPEIFTKVGQYGHICKKCKSELEIVDDFEDKLHKGEIPCLKCGGIMRIDIVYTWD